MDELRTSLESRHPEDLDGAPRSTIGDARQEIWATTQRDGGLHLPSSSRVPRISLLSEVAAQSPDVGGDLVHADLHSLRRHIRHRFWNRGHRSVLDLDAGKSAASSLPKDRMSQDKHPSDVMSSHAIPDNSKKLPWESETSAFEPQHRRL